MREFILDHYQLDNIILKTSNDISLYSNNSDIKNVTISPININRVFLDGEYHTTNISIENSCKLIALTSFHCDNPINVNNTNSAPLTLLIAGDFSGSPSGININNNINLTTLDNLVLYNINLNIAENCNVNFSGNFSEANISMKNNSSITLTSPVSSIKTAANETVNITLNEGASIKDTSFLKSKIILSGDEETIKSFISNSNIPTANITLSSSSYLISFDNGKASIALPTLNNTTSLFSQPGTYKVTASILSSTFEYPISNPITISINTN